MKRKLALERPQEAVLGPDTATERRKKMHGKEKWRSFEVAPQGEGGDGSQERDHPPGGRGKGGKKCVGTSRKENVLRGLGKRLSEQKGNPLTA